MDFQMFVNVIFPTSNVCVFVSRACFLFGKFCFFFEWFTPINQDSWCCLNTHKMKLVVNCYSHEFLSSKFVTNIVWNIYIACWAVAAVIDWTFNGYIMKAVVMIENYCNLIHIAVITGQDMYILNIAYTQVLHWNPVTVLTFIEFQCKVMRLRGAPQTCEIVGSTGFFNCPKYWKRLFFCKETHIKLIFSEI
jgi:hypothetical protein